jgi:hypothetical protein
MLYSLKENSPCIHVTNLESFRDQYGCSAIVQRCKISEISLNSGGWNTLATPTSKCGGCNPLTPGDYAHGYSIKNKRSICDVLK